MTRLTPVLPNRATNMLCCVILALISFISAFPAKAQEAKQWTERGNFGFKGPVRSVLTTVLRPNPDPRPNTRRKLFVERNPDWAVFDIQGRRIEYASATNRDGIVAISKCAFNADGKTCEDGAGQQQESREQRTILPDGSREVTYFHGSEVGSREVTQFDEKGTAVSSRTYRGDGKLNSEELTLPNGDHESKIYDDRGSVVSDEQTRVSEDKNRFDRWSYDSDGHLVWNIALNSDGELLAYWYDIGFKPKVSSSDSLGVYRPGLSVDYKFDDQGSGRLEKTVQHTQGEGNLEPESEEHYNFDGIMDEKAEIKYAHDGHGNWISRSVFVWNPDSNQMIEIERDTRTIEYY